MNAKFARIYSTHFFNEENLNDANVLDVIKEIGKECELPVGQFQISYKLRYGDQKLIVSSLRYLDYEVEVIKMNGDYQCELIIKW